VLLIGLYVSACMWVPGIVSMYMCISHVALLIQHGTHLHHLVTSFVAPWFSPHFLILSHNWCNFWKMLLNIKCVCSFSLQLLSKTFPIP
jgi:hypothetical protein